MGQAPAGAFVSPTKTMFQFQPVHLAHSLLRDIHCCCEPESTVPSTSVSDIHPPLAQPCISCSTRLPRTCIRRSGAAWETAHCIVPPVGTAEKFSVARQN